MPPAPLLREGGSSRSGGLGLAVDTPDGLALVEPTAADLMLSDLNSGEFPSSAFASIALESAALTSNGFNFVWLVVLRFCICRSEWAWPCFDWPSFDWLCFDWLCVVQFEVDRFGFDRHWGCRAPVLPAAGRAQVPCRAARPPASNETASAAALTCCSGGEIWRRRNHDRGRPVDNRRHAVRSALSAVRGAGRAATSKPCVLLVSHLLPSCLRRLRPCAACSVPVVYSVPRTLMRERQVRERSCESVK